VGAANVLGKLVHEHFGGESRFAACAVELRRRQARGYEGTRLRRFAAGYTVKLDQRLRRICLWSGGENTHRWMFWHVDEPENVAVALIRLDVLDGTCPKPLALGEESEEVRGSLNER